MNLLHLKYLLEIEKQGSISKAANALYMKQPRLSKILSEWEDSLGIIIFERSSQGVSVTRKGKEFLNKARKIVTEMEDIERMYKHEDEKFLDLSFCMPRASYISFALMEYLSSQDLMNQDIFVDCRETNSLETIRCINDGEFNFGIVRYMKKDEKHFLNLLEENGLSHKELFIFSLKAIMSRKHPLALQEHIEYDELHKYVEIYNGDNGLPSEPNAFTEYNHGHEPVHTHHMSVYDRGTHLAMLRNIPCTYMWCSPFPQEVLDRYDLVQRDIDHAIEDDTVDILIYRKGYQFLRKEKQFIAHIYKVVDTL